MKTLALCLAVSGVSLSVLAEQTEPQPESPPARYLLGLSVANRPDYDGSDVRKTQARPLWALQLGRWRFSTSGASALLGFGRDGGGAGASTQLIDNDRWRLGVALGIDGGRQSDDAGSTRGLPNVQRTLRARLHASGSLMPDLNLSASLSQDLLGHRGGLIASADVGWRIYRSATLEWTSGIGVSAADAQNLRSYFGVPASAVAASGKPAYEPGAGLRDLHVGTGFTRPLSAQWFVFGSAGVSRLLGPAAGSPLVLKRDDVSLSVGVAWRR
ncbi:MAG: MipA/OmpV family protein [Burkholderiales bacterium]|uniref:MipA/OmpV family protein n=1 Tax=Roseateles sp. TaxID=1971397 RepID=UPI000FB06E28|nr:MAG: MipA/OmpV family protein [Burkholderiales bacterium]